MEVLEGSHRLNNLMLLSCLFAIAETLPETKISQAPQETRLERLKKKKRSSNLRCSKKLDYQIIDAAVYNPCTLV